MTLLPLPNTASETRPAVEVPVPGSVVPGEFLFKLISVSYREAALDLPSFRASVNHLDTQLLQTEDWFMALADLFLKVPQKIEEFRSVFAILDHLVPSFVQDNVLDQEYSMAMFQHSRKTLRELWAMAFSVFRINTATIEQRKADFSQHVLRFRRLKRDFVRCQKKYDHYYHTHMGTPKYKEPALLYEDLRQLAGVRREYMLLSVELVAATHSVTEQINGTILSLNELFWRVKTEHLTGSFLDAAQLADVWRTVVRLRAWHEACVAANGMLDAQLATARRQVEAQVAASCLPAESETDYRPDLLNGRVLRDIDEPAAEKHGYVCMKTQPDRQARPVWLRRWAYIRNGVLGFLVLAPNGEAVQESDRIGVLLCSVRHTPNEDRHFCFEVKTIDSTWVLQAETLHELKSWLRVLENAQRRVVDPDDAMHTYLAAASRRLAPPITEFLSPELSSHGSALPRRLARLLERNAAFFDKNVLGSVGRVNLPVVTAATKMALVASSVAAGPYDPPPGADANLCGSVSWALRATAQVSARPVVVEPLQPSQTRQVGSGMRLPKNFPDAWVARDLQMRALFGEAVGPHEHCLVAYNCLVVPNDSHELRATHYVTQAHLYSYVHTRGFVAMTKIPLNRFVQVSCEQSTKHDTLRLVLVHGVLVLRLYFDDGVLLARKLNFLFQNLARSVPLTTLDVIAEVAAIDAAHQAAAVQPHDAPAAIPPHFAFVAGGLPLPGSFQEAASFANELPLMAQKTVPLPPKAVFHVLCGAESEILNVLTAMVEVQFSERSPWKQAPNGQPGLMRDNRSAFRLPSGQQGSITVSQHIEVQADNEFYSIKVTKSALKVFCGPRLRFEARITIHKMEAERAVVRIYGRPIIDEAPLKSFVASRLCNMFVRGFTAHVFRELDVACAIIGQKGRVLKAVYFYGKIVVADERYEPVVLDPVPIGRYGLISVCLKIMVANAFRTLAAWGLVAGGMARRMLHALSLHAVLIAIVLLLTLSNMYLGAVSARNYWTSRQSRILAHDLLSMEPMQIHRAVYLQDIQDLVSEDLALQSDSACFQTFRNQSVVLNFHGFTGWNDVFQDTPIAVKRQRLSERLRDIASKRNDLLVSLRLLHNLEEEEARAEWRDWLMDELDTCSQISSLNLLKQAGAAGDGLRMKSLGDYCDSCALELSAIPASV
ncbi:hypothetical protein METBIDRAFT_76151 [Metschnikowia bicuspidata var. bicuspidata NRRL YB-4993]|uniref:PH domain-containing protein n=1 Tax=Metschnikowia bicuspidata var. bicuspidata NRRL YB-4993 TaxID=869754 RepID=A0A1A0HGB7_9ASCO|nr:hypothetical protein METBIDRAFT_76151 [Metschnikowia bicuspidata var. bicuspidata NRRL YB-4993]OBA23035.1 hypothetical protein METBIDRAFT_76151 [Metschnikowia bicuspidata var. bicuspidata NRRL YB-4993]